MAESQKEKLLGVTLEKTLPFKYHQEKAYK